VTKPLPRGKSKLIATWSALLAGSMGVHRFYLYGLGDRWAWLFVVPTLLGLHGLQRVQQFGLDDKLSWLLLPALGLSLTASMLSAIRYGLTPDEQWNARFDSAPGTTSDATWVTILGVVLALALGAAALMATIAFSAQRFFEYQAESAPPPPQKPTGTTPG
jgi:hypothetical protein